VCPKKAISRDEELGRVVIDYDQCIGCKMCVMACPFGAMSVDLEEEQVIKCDLCSGEPTCVRFCDAKALKYVEADVAHLEKKRSSGARFSELMRSYG
jgi:Fe-S-cluster-containing hydrogenase component 2